MILVARPYRSGTIVATGRRLGKAVSTDLGVVPQS
jgi:hypothetical protein